jgi:hypothetical protein
MPKQHQQWRWIVTEYVVKLAFWLRAWDSVTIEADADAEAIDKAKAAAKRAMESRVIPESIDTDRRREGLIAFVDRLGPDRRECVVEDVVFDDDHIHGPLHDFVRRVAAMPTGEPEPTTGSHVGVGPWRALTEEARRLLGPDP